MEKEQRAYSVVARSHERKQLSKDACYKSPSKDISGVYRPQGRHGAGNSINKKAKMDKSGTGQTAPVSVILKKKEKKTRGKNLGKLCSWLFQFGLTGCFCYPTGVPEFFPGGKKTGERLVMTRGYNSG